MKGSSFWMWFLVSACAPFIGLIAAVCYRWDNRELRRECPSCGKVLKLYDAVCMRCGTELEFPEYALSSEADSETRRRQATAT
jgi:predicted amidophosphoribosyltransferase